MTIDEIKQKVSIIEFIKFRKDLDFTFKREGQYLKAYVPVRDKENNIQVQNDKVLKKEHIIICRLDKLAEDKETVIGKHEVYYEVGNMDVKKPKSIIDFVSEFVLRENKIDFTKVMGVLYRYMNNPSFVHIDESKIDLIAKNKIKQSNEKSKKIVFDLPSKNTFDYLKGRGLETKTLLDDKFIGTYGSYTIPEKGIADRPAFSLISKDNKLQTVQWVDYSNGTRGELGKRFVEGVKRENALYKTNYHIENNVICLLESPEKAMAHYQLFQNNLKEQNNNPLYLSSCGTITKNDLITVEDLAKNKNFNKYILAFDNDERGNVFTINTIFHLNKIDSYATLGEDSNGKRGFIIKSEDSNKTQEFLNSKKINFKTENNTLFILDDFEKISKKLTSPTMVIHTSITKDFLDDLQDNKKLPFNFNPKINNTNNLNL